MSGISRYIRYQLKFFIRRIVCNIIGHDWFAWCNNHNKKWCAMCGRYTSDYPKMRKRIKKY
jgi:hypothetical protein